MTASEHTELLPDRDRMRKALELWFFRDLADEQRYKLGLLCGLPGHAWPISREQQRTFLRHVLNAIARNPTPLPVGAEPVPVAWPSILVTRDEDGRYVQLKVDGELIAQRLSNTPSGVAILKLAAALHPTSETPPPGRLCATDGCERAGTKYFERGGVGSHYCPECIARIEALSEARHG